MCVFFLYPNLKYLFSFYVSTEVSTSMHFKKVSSKHSSDIIIRSHNPTHKRRPRATITRQPNDMDSRFSANLPVKKFARRDSRSARREKKAEISF